MLYGSKNLADETIDKLNGAFKEIFKQRYDSPVREVEGTGGNSSGRDYEHIGRTHYDRGSKSAGNPE